MTVHPEDVSCESVRLRDSTDHHFSGIMVTHPVRNRPAPLLDHLFGMYLGAPRFGGRGCHQSRVIAWEPKEEERDKMRGVTGREDT